MPIINQVVKGGGTQPSGTIAINTNGVHDVAGYANADVQVPTSAPDYYYEYTVTNARVSKGYKPFNFSGINTVGNNAFLNFYAGLTIPNTTHIDMSDITTVEVTGCYQMFQSCYGDFSVDLSGLTTLGSSGCYRMFASSQVTDVDLSGLEVIQNASCVDMFLNCNRLINVDISGITTIAANSCQGMFHGCTSLTSIDLSSLRTIDGNQACVNMFNGCTGLTSVNLSSLETVVGNYALQSMFEGCTSLTSLYLPSLVTDTDRTSRALTATTFATNITCLDMRYLQNCGNYGILDSILYTNEVIQQVNFNSLKHIGTEGARTMFYTNSASTSLSDVYFPMLTSFGTNPFYSNAFYNKRNCTIHFRKDMQSVVQALPNYSSLWGAGTGTSAVFDLIGTLSGVDGNDYLRSEKDSVYASETAGAAKTATAWKYNDTIYYTTGSTEPQIGDTIYSDSACTTAVTTVDSIA